MLGCDKLEIPISQTPEWENTPSPTGFSNENMIRARQKLCMPLVQDMEKNESMYLLQW